MPVIRVRVLSDRLAKLLQCNDTSITIEPGTYTINDMINFISTQIPGIKVVLDRMKDIVFVAVNGQVKYNFDEKIEVVDSVKITLFEVGAGG